MQIPKIIHYFYDDVNPWTKGKNPQFRMCLYSWKKACPDYALMLWHEKSPEFGQILQQSLFVRKAYELKLWAFVSDYVRLYVLNKYGAFMWIRMFSCCKTLTSFWMTVFLSVLKAISTDRKTSPSLP